MVFRDVPQGPQYLGPMPDQPFPVNPLFRSLPVLADETKELIWDKITKRGETIKSVSAEMSIDVRRVAAVVRLKAVQRQWEEDVSWSPDFACCCLREDSGRAMMRCQKKID